MKIGKDINFEYCTTLNQKNRNVTHFIQNFCKKENCAKQINLNGIDQERSIALVSDLPLVFPSMPSVPTHLLVNVKYR